MDAVEWGRRLLRPLWVVGFCLLATAASAADLSLSNFTEESSERVSGIPATWDLGYRAEVTNSGALDYTDVRLVIDDPPEEIEVIDGELNFGDVPAGATVPSLDTFTLRESRRILRNNYPYPPADLQWDLWVNTAPVADAGADQTVELGATATLDGSASYDSDGDPLTFAWQFLSRPDSSAAVLDDPTAAQPTFVVDAYGEYEIELVVNDGHVDSIPDTVKVTTGNAAPEADAGPDQSVFWGETVYLDGSGSSDPNGHPLTFYWEILAAPAGSAATLSDPTLVNPSFTVDVSGEDVEYIIELTVSDGEYQDSDTVTVTTDNTAPVADAGPDQTVMVDTTVQLDGSGSNDVDGDPLTFDWAFTSRPDGSTATLSDPTAVQPTFYVDLPGLYVVRLIVNDGELDSLPDSVNVTTGNSPPEADAGEDQIVPLGATVQLEGSDSHDPDLDPLTYAWSLTSVPADSAAVLSATDTVDPTFVADLAGEYVAQLIVDDGEFSDDDQVSITTANTRPVADAGADQTVVVDTTVQLDGSGSHDPDEDPLLFDWSFSYLPYGSLAELSDPNAVAPTFLADVVDDFVVQLIVSDGLLDSDPPDSAIITVQAGGTIPPVADAGADQSAYAGEVVQLDGSASYDPEGEPVTYSWSWETLPGGSTAVLAGVDTAQPSFLADVAGTYVIALVVNDGIADSTPDSVSVAVEEYVVTLPPDPAEVAPELDLTVATTLDVASEYLYTGDDPIQTGVEPGTIDPVRVAVLRGKVTTRDRVPLPGAAITVLGHPEYGQTLSREDGLFDLAVNGGGRLTLVYKRPGYLTAQRQREVPWQDYAWMPPVSLIPLDANVTHVDLEAPGMKVARGSVATDADGPRQATILVPEGITAELVLADGSTQPLSSLNVRATEFTVGPNGPQAMPAELPPSVAYTYAFEVSTDEAIAADAPLVQFNEPVYFYVENFLGFENGGGVPTGYYDRERGEWVASPNGRVIQILGVIGDRADLDTDGDGLADDAAILAELGVTDAERIRLAGLYTPGQSLWRVPMPHFTMPWDCNWPVGFPPGAGSPPGGGGDPEGGDDGDGPPPGDGCSEEGSIIGCHNQTLGERLPLVGTPYDLNYQSYRTPGRKPAYTLTIPLIGDEVHEDLLYIERTVSVAGNPVDVSPFYAQFAPEPNLADTFTWDGTDSAGRTLQGPQPVTVEICYWYEGFYYEVPADFASSFGAVCPECVISPVVRDATGGLIELCRSWEGGIGAWDARVLGLGGWSLDPHHAYLPSYRKLYLGDGRSRNANSVANVIDTVAGNGELGGLVEQNVPAIDVPIAPDKLDVGPDGSWYFADVYTTTSRSAIHKVDPEGIITTVAGGNGAGFSGDGGLATDAQLAHPTSVAVAADGSLYIADMYNHRIRRVSPEGMISTFAGNGISGFGGDGGPATEASLQYPRDVDVGPDGTVYIADYDNVRVRAVAPDGIIRTVAGYGMCNLYNPNDGGAATRACIGYPGGISVGADGVLYIAQDSGHRIRKVTVDGIITTVAGNGSGGFSGDGGLATEAQLAVPFDVFVDGEGRLYIADTWNNRVRSVGVDGIIYTVAGSESNYDFSGDDGPATAAQLSFPQGVGVGADGFLYISDSTNYRIRRVTRVLEGFSAADIAIPSQDGGQYYKFDLYGRHLETEDTLTGLPLYSFTYDAEGRLASIQDRDENPTTIERDANGTDLAIVGPYGQRTEMTLDENGYLASLTNPAGETHAFTYSDDGLLETTTDPREGTYRAFYDGDGRLVRTEDPAGGFKTLARTELEDGYEVALTSALGRVTTYRSRTLPTGDRERVNTFPNGTQSQALIGTDGTTVITEPDGTVMTRVSGPDPRFGMLSPILESFTTEMPGGLTSVSNSTQEVMLTDPNDLLSLETRTVTYTRNGRTSVETFDAATHELVTTTPEGRLSTTTLDMLGHVARIAESGLLPSTFTYDAQGRLESTSRGEGEDERTTVWGYDLDGLLASITDPELQVTQYQYDPAGRTVKVIRNDGAEFDFGYDANGNRTAIVPPIRPVHLFGYTPVDLQENYTAPDIGTASSSTLYEYDLDRQMTRMLRPDGADIDLVYDTAGRLVERQLPDRTLTYTYDPATGQRTGIASSDGQNLTFTHDGFLETGTQWAGVINGIVTRTYDADFNIATESVNGEHTVAFAYDNDGQTTGAGALAITRDPQTGVIVGSSLGDISTTLAWNGFGEVVHFDAAHAGANLLSLAYVKDKLSRITQKTETVDGTTDVHGYAYDAAGRLAQVTENATPVANYAYDDNGNRLSTETGAGTLSATYDDQDRLVSYGDSTYAYTDNGELLTRTDTVSGDVTSYAYDVLGNLRSVTLPNGTLIEYVVDGQSRRVGRKVNGTLVQAFLYRDTLNPVAELDGAGNVVSRFVYGTKLNVPDYVERDGNTYRIVADHLGSPRVVVDTATGAVVQRMDYDAFGQVTLDTSPGFQPFGFAGGIYDSQTGLVRFGARDYDATIGRWTLKDPIRFEGGTTNLYEYAFSDPVNFYDSSGLNSCVRECILQWKDSKRENETESGRDYQHFCEEEVNRCMRDADTEIEFAACFNNHSRCEAGNERVRRERDTGSDLELIRCLTERCGIACEGPESP